MYLLFSVLIFLSLACSLVISKSIRVTTIGDSITEGGGCVKDSYTVILQKMLGIEYEVFNAGVSGQTMLKNGKCNVGEDDPPSNYGDCSYWKTDAWQNAQKSTPDIVTIMLGTNDAKSFNWEGVQQDLGDYFALDAVSMINTLRSLIPTPKIYIMIPPPLYEPFPWQMNATVINEIYPIFMRNLATVMNCQIIDVNSAFLNSINQNLTCDGCHPTEHGNFIIATSIYNVITNN